MISFVISMWYFQLHCSWCSRWIYYTVVIFLWIWLWLLKSLGFRKKLVSVSDPACFRLLYLVRCFQFYYICLFLNRSTYLYDILRPKLIHEANIDLLCELVHILKVEVLGEQPARQSEPLAGLRPTLQRILADVNERLTFRARTYIRDEVQCLTYQQILR